MTSPAFPLPLFLLFSLQIPAICLQDSRWAQQTLRVLVEGGCKWRDADFLGDFFSFFPDLSCFFWLSWQEKSILLWLGAAGKMKTRETFTDDSRHPKKIHLCSDSEPEVCLVTGVSIVPFIWGAQSPLQGRAPRFPVGKRR